MEQLLSISIAAQTPVVSSLTRLISSRITCLCNISVITFNWLIKPIGWVKLKCMMCDEQ